MRKRKTHFEQIPLEKIKMHVEKRQRKKTKGAVSRKPARKEPVSRLD
jgi:hypothetical protein